MKLIPTVNGPVDSSLLGVTLAHEHIFVHSEGVISNFPHLWDREASIQLARQKLTAAYEAGVRTIWDMSILGNGRDITTVREAVQDLPIHVIAATGVFYPDQLPGLFHDQSIRYLADAFLHDLTEGIGNTSIRAALIKVCTDAQGVTPDVEKSLRAAAWAQRESGCPIHTHAAGQSGLLQQTILAEEGVDLSRVYIGHVIDCPDLDYARRLMDRGSFIGFDRFASVPPDHPKIKRAIAFLTQLCKEGYANQILVGNDGCCYQTVVRFQPPESSPSLEGNDYLIFYQDILPQLVNAGVTPAQLQLMLEDNPRRLLEGGASAVM